uniref:Uncharacterized protein n=1 Tax=Anguilla anguilla TaxID=7936 RepID=A0A0E9U6K4_ANGAN
MSPQFFIVWLCETPSEFCLFT